MLQQKKPRDYIISTGRMYTVRQFINESIKYFGFDTYWTGRKKNEKLKLKKNNKTIIKINKKFYRPNEVEKLLGDASLTEKQLKWKPTVDFKNLVKIMSLSDLKIYNK